MKSGLLALVLGLPFFVRPIHAQVNVATVYVLHGIQGQDLHLQAARRRGPLPQE